MKAGHDLDAEVARHILGWRVEGESWYPPGATATAELPQFSRDLKAAWQITELICDEGFRLQLTGSRSWQARFYKSVAHTLETRSYEATAREPAAAICLAALAIKTAASV